MNEPFRLFRREKVYYVQDNATGEQLSLRTEDKSEAKRLFHAKCEASRMGSLNLQIARTYMVAVDPELPTRTWRQLVRFIIEKKDPGPTRHRWEIVEKDKAFSKLWKMRIAKTRADQLMAILKAETVSTNVFLRRMHNFALDMNWLAWPILPKKKWPKVVYQEKRGISREEHEKIIARETNPERRDFYETLLAPGRLADGHSKLARRRHQLERSRNLLSPEEKRSGGSSAIW